MAVTAMVGVLPVYVITAREFGWVHAKSVQEDGASLIDALLADHGLFHLEADLRWIDLTAARLAVLAEEVGL